MIIKMLIAYDGSYFHGFQRQERVVTVQGQLEKALKAALKEDITVHPSGRTDKGVHALGQVISFSYEGKIPPEKLTFVVNHQLEPQIRVLSSEVMADDFHARYLAKGKKYIYKVSYHQLAKLHLRDYYFYVDQPLQVEAMESAAKHLLGEHDFISFSASRGFDQNTVRTIHSITFHEVMDGLEIHYEGSGFLYMMVRILSQQLIEIGRGQLDEETLLQRLHLRTRDYRKRVAPPGGLYLAKVHY